MRPRQQRVVPSDRASRVVVRVLKNGNLARPPSREARLPDVARRDGPRNDLVVVRTARTGPEDVEEVAVIPDT